MRTRGERVSRSTTCRILDAIDEGILDPVEVLRAALNYMSEDDVADMAHSERYFSDEDENEDDEEP
jgi:hypothetical protein